MFKQLLSDVLQFQSQLEGEQQKITIEYLEKITYILSKQTRYKQLKDLNLRYLTVYQYISTKCKVNLTKYKLNSYINLHQSYPDQILIRTSICQICKKENSSIVINDSMFFIICDACATKYLKTPCIYNVRQLLTHPEMQNFIGERFILLYYKFLQVNIDNNNQLNTVQLLKQMKQTRRFSTKNYEQKEQLNQGPIQKTIRLQNNLTYECKNYVLYGINEFACVNDPFKKSIVIYGLSNNNNDITQALVNQFSHRIQFYKVENQIIDELQDIQDNNLQASGEIINQNQYIIDYEKQIDFDIRNLFIALFSINQSDIFGRMSKAPVVAKHIFNYIRTNIIAFQPVSDNIDSNNKGQHQDQIELNYNTGPEHDLDYKTIPLYKDMPIYYFYDVRALFNVQNEVQISNLKSSVNEVTQYEIEDYFINHFKQQQLINVMNDEVYVLQKQVIQYLIDNKESSIAKILDVMKVFNININQYGINSDEYNSKNALQMLKKLDDVF